MTDEPEPAAPSQEDQGRSRRQATTITAIVGTAFSVLFIVSIGILLAIPGGWASDDEIARFYASDAAILPVIVGLYLMPFAGIAFIWFIVALRMWAAASDRRPTILQSNVQLVSGIAFVILTFVGAAASSVVAASAQLGGGQIDPEAARQFPIFGRAIALFFEVKMAAMFVITTSLIGRGPKAFPDWFVFVGFIVGIFLGLSPVFSPFLVLAFPIWVLVLCWIVFRAARRIPKDLPLGDRLPGRVAVDGRAGPPNAPGL